MAVYNTASDSANTAVRAFLTKVGEYYLGHSFNTASGKGRKLWWAIRDEDFRGKCAYCGEQSNPLQIEHVLMFNRAEFGLHHPGNIVPCCKLCNKRERKSDKSFCNWEEHLHKVCKQRGELQQFEERKLRILGNFSKYSYPRLNTNEQHAIRVIANSLYENIKAESDKSLDLYRQLDEAFVK
ncbi:hypothetical protein AAOGI_35840 [Agarivorans albus]